MWKKEKRKNARDITMYNYIFYYRETSMRPSEVTHCKKKKKTI